MSLKLNVGNLSPKGGSYEGLKKGITKEDYFKNIFDIGNYRRDVQVQKLGKELMNQKPDFKEEDYNAFYNYKNNELYILAGYVHAFIYGATGLGHEIMHGFDGDGLKWDEKGRKIQWWTNKENVEYKKRTQCLVGNYLFFNDFSSFRPRLTSMLILKFPLTGEFGNLRINLTTLTKTLQTTVARRQNYMQANSISGTDTHMSH